MNNEERRRILDLVSSGKISPAEAEDLLSALDYNSAESQIPASDFAMATTPALPQAQTKRRTIIIQMKSDDTKLNLRLPLGLATATSRFIPRQAQQYFEAHQIDLGQLLSTLGQAPQEGTLMELQDDDDSIRISVE